MSIQFSEQSIPFTYGVKELVPAFLLDCDLSKKTEGNAAFALHAFRCSTAILTKTALIVMGLVELFARKAFAFLKEGYQTVFTPEQRAQIAQSIIRAKHSLIEGYARLCGTLFEKAQRPT